MNRGNGDTDMMHELEPGQTVEWRNQSGQTWTATGIYLGPDNGPLIGDTSFARVDTPDGEWLVRAHLLRQPGELAAEDTALADLTERAKGYPIGDDGHAQYCRKNRSPWCDTCKRPSVAGEWQGLCHSTAEHPFGVPEHLDDSGHVVTHHEWFQVPR